MAVITVHFFYEALGFCQICHVILPQRRDGAPDVPLKVLWLLHGAFGNHYDWMRRTSIERYAAPYGLAVVMPSAQNSKYVDMAHGGKYYTYIAEELPRKMRTFFNFSDKREDNFIAGLSMGGAGSLTIGLSRPEQYAAVGCLSAGAEVVMYKNRANEEKVFWALDGKTLEGTRYDSFVCARQTLEAGGPYPRIYHACGLQDHLLPAARETRDFFTAINGNPFDYTYEEDEGSHTWEYWDEHIQHFIQFLHLEKTQDFC